MSVVGPKGFKAAAVAAGIKKSDDLDLSLVVADDLAVAAAVFTTSQTAAAPVQLSKIRVGSGRARAVLLNSGGANASTGAGGMAVSVSTTGRVAELLGCDPEQVLVCSTGVIGIRLPEAKMLAAIPGLVESLDSDPRSGLNAARGIMTTDSLPKQVLIDLEGAFIGGMVKGAGMIRPNMATMLCVLTTDLAVEAESLQRALKDAVDVTFNCLNVDGCQSTNDTVIALASGLSGITPDQGQLSQWLEQACRDLVEQMASDAEGTTKKIHINVSGAACTADARTLGMAVADSALVRCSFYGGDPNWGRVVGALGVAGIQLDQSRISVSFEGIPVCVNGSAAGADDEAVASLLTGDFTVDVSVGDGPGQVTVVTTDLTPEYVHFNSERS